MRDRRHGAPWMRHQWCYSGPLVEHLEEFLKCRVEERYSPHSVNHKRAFVAALSHWLERRQIPLVRFNEAVLRRFRKRHAYRAGYGDATTERQLLEFLRACDVIPAAAPVPMDRSPLGKLTDDYERFLSGERSLAQITRVDQMRVVRRFLGQRFARQALRLKTLRPRDVHRFLLKEGKRVNRGRVQHAASALRSFLRYLHQRGLIARDLVGAVPRIASWRLSQLPKFLPAKDIDALLRSCDRRTRLGRRDYAMLLLMGRLGLRSGEVAALTLEDFNWQGSEFTVRGKGSRHESLPLPQEVGTALLAYLRHARPTACPSRHVFVRLRAPHRRFVDGRSVNYVVQSALKRAGLNPPFKGSHLLRHSLATNLLRRGASLVEIGQLLRHHKQVTTQIYAKVDLKALRPIALPWMGGAR